MGRYRELTSNTIIFAIGNLGSKLIHFFLLPLMTTKLSPADFNIIELLSLAKELLLPMLVLGLNDAVFRFTISNKYKKESVLANVLVFTFIELTIIGVGVFIINSITPTDYWYLFALACAATAFNSTLSIFSRSLGKSKTFAFSGIIQSIAVFIFAFIFVYKMERGVVGYMWAMILSSISRIVILFIFGGIVKSFSLKSFDKKLLAAMLIYSLPLVLNSLSWWIINSLNKFISTAILGNEISGLFAAASKLPTQVTVVTSIFMQAWTISSSKTVDDKDRSKFYSTVFSYFCFIITIVCSAALLLLPYVSKFLLKGEFSMAWKYSGMLMISSVLSSFSAFLGTFYAANLKTKMALVSTVIGAVISLATAISLIYFIQLHALVLASNICYLVIVIIRIINTKKISGLKINYFVEIPVFLLLLTQALIANFAKDNLTLVQLGLFIAIVSVRFRDVINAYKLTIRYFKGRRKSKTDHPNA